MVSQAGPHVSVIVPFLDAARFLDRCLDGLLAQTWPASRLDIVFVDNNSRDDGPVRVRRRLADEPRLRLLHEPRQGAYAARNRGLAATTAPLIAFTDPDCAPEPTWIERLYDALEADERRQVVMGWDRPAGDGAMLRLLSAYDRGKQELVLNAGEVRFLYGHTNNMLVRRAAFDAVGPFELRMRGADTIFVQRVARRFGPAAIAQDSRAVVHHLEVADAAQWYVKAFTYGRSARGYEQRVPVEALGARERWEIYRHVVRADRLSAWQAGALLGLLGVGYGAWVLGRASA